MDSMDHLEALIHLGIQRHPIKAIVDNEPYGFNCVVEFPIQGLGSYSGRRANLRTVWELVDQLLPPRMISAFLKD